jgi:ankyrin repeat protein
LVLLALSALLPACKGTGMPEAATPSGDLKVQRPKVAERPLEGELFRAVRRLDVDEVRRLLGQGADPNENVGTEDEPLHPLWLATAMAFQDQADSRPRSIMSILRYRGASPYVDFEGVSALDIAIQSEQDELVRLLLSTR